MNIGTQHALDNSLTCQIPPTDEWWEESGTRDSSGSRRFRDSRLGMQGKPGCRLNRLGRQIQVYKQHRRSQLGGNTGFREPAGGQPGH